MLLLLFTAFTAVAANDAPFPCAFDDCRTQTFYVIPAPNPVITATGGKVRHTKAEGRFQILCG